MLISKRIYSKVDGGVLRWKSLISTVEKVVLGVEMVLFRSVFIIGRSAVGVLLTLS